MNLNITLFVEDFAHESFLKPLLVRIADRHDVEITIRLRSKRGGHGKALTEFREFIQDIDAGRERLPDILIVAIDSNCHGYSQVKGEIEEAAGKFKDIVICAVPDPHIQRWLLIDSAAFKAVFGRGCAAPDQKCQRDRYKEVAHERHYRGRRHPIL